MKTVTFFNERGGVGKTTLTANIAWMLANFGVKVLLIDLDPQADLSSWLLGRERLNELWLQETRPTTIFGAIREAFKDHGQYVNPHFEEIQDNIALIPGDFALSLLDGRQTVQIAQALHTIYQNGGKEFNADIIFIDMAPSISGLNKASLLVTNWLITPLFLNSFTALMLRQLGPIFRRLRREWLDELKNYPDAEFSADILQPMGYVITRHTEAQAEMTERFITQAMLDIPQAYHQALLGAVPPSTLSIKDDSYCLSIIKNYQSLAFLAQQAHKSFFDLKPADGVLGALLAAGQSAYWNFKALALKIAERCEIAIDQQASDHAS